MFKLAEDVTAGCARITECIAAGDPEDSIRNAAAAIDVILAAAYEAGDTRAVQVLHAVTALLTATRH